MASGKKQPTWQQRQSGFKSASVPADRPAVPVVGLGASAGGLEALEAFFQNVPIDCGLAFVVVQHLDPTYKGMMVELLQRFTPMPIAQVQDKTRVLPNHVYVIPPDRDLSILRGVLHLLEPTAPRGLRLPIDFFFRALADDLHQDAIAVILSGMGSDGTLGLRAIKEKAGVAFVQDPASAKFDAMPRSAIDAGLADVVAPPQELPARIIAYFTHRPTLTPSASTPAGADDGSMAKVLILLRAQTGHDFSLYKKTTISRRVERRMGLHQFSKIADYLRYLRENPQEATLLFNEILIGVTSFFRDPDVWAQLQSEAIPALIAAKPLGGVLRAWVVGCSTGEEAYSLAIALKETIENVRPPHPVSLQIFATDLDKDAIDKARAGLFPSSIAADVSEERLNRFFIREDRCYRIRKEIRETVIFAPHNVVSDPPFTKLDLLTCRNVMIYFEPELQKRLLNLFQYSLLPEGILLLGTAESIGSANDRFTPLPGKSRLFRRNPSPAAPAFIDLPSAYHRPRILKDSRLTTKHDAQAPASNVQALTEQLLLKRYVPAAVLVNEQGDIISINGKTGKYLEPAAGKANWNLFAMARDGLAESLAPAFREAMQRRELVRLNNVMVGTNGERQAVNVSIQPVPDSEPLHGMVLIVFTDTAAQHPAEPLAPPADTDESPELQRELQSARREISRLREDLQRSHEERQTASEELQSTNEELQSTNEELQSTNEELMTSKEEMQSMNEELQTINHELQSKVDELSRASSDMKNLLNSTDIAILFLDESLNVRRFTPPTSSIIKLIPADVGRPITDIASELDYPTLAEDAGRVLQTLVSRETHVSARDGRWFTVRILPYRTHDNRIDGVVVTFTDISVSRRLEEELRQAQSQLQLRLTQKTAELKQATQERAPGISRQQTTDTNSSPAPQHGSTEKP